MVRKLLTSALIGLLGFGVPNYALAQTPPDKDDSVEVTYNRKPVASIEDLTRTAIVGEAVRLQSRSTDADGDALTLDWYVTPHGTPPDLAGTPTLSGAELQHTFSVVGKYDVTLRARDPSGEENITGMIIDVKAKAAVFVPPVVVPSKLDSLQLFLGVGAGSIDNLQALRLPTVNTDTTYQNKGFNVGVGIDRLSYELFSQATKRLLLEGSVFFGYTSLKNDDQGKVMVGDKQTGNLSGSRFDVSLSPAIRYEADKTNSAVLQLLLDFSKLSLNGINHRAGFKQNESLEDTTLDWNLGLVGSYQLGDSLNYIRTGLGLAYESFGRTGLTGVVGVFDLKAQLNTGFLTANPSYPFTTSVAYRLDFALQNDLGLSGLSNDNLQVNSLMHRVIADMAFPVANCVSLGGRFQYTESVLDSAKLKDGRDLPITHGQKDYQGIFFVSYDFGKECKKW